MKYSWHYNDKTLTSIFFTAFAIVSMTLIVFGQSKDTKKTFYTIDASKSYLTWKIDAHHGKVNICKGTFRVEEGEITAGHFTICMDSIVNLDIEYDLMRQVLENTLMSKELFDAKRYPYATFKIQQAKPISDDKIKIYGDLMLKGIEKCIAFEAKIKAEMGQFSAQSESFGIDRTDWGITAMSKNFSSSEESYIVRDTVVIQVIVNATIATK